MSVGIRHINSASDGQQNRLNCVKPFCNSVHTEKEVIWFSSWECFSKEGGGTGGWISLLPTFWANFSLPPTPPPPISPSSLKFYLLFPLFLPPPNFVWAISPSSLFCSSPFSKENDILCHVVYQKKSAYPHAKESSWHKEKGKWRKHKEKWIALENTREM